MLVQYVPITNQFVHGGSVLKRIVFVLLTFAWSVCAFAQTVEFYAVDVGPNRAAPWQVVKYDGNGQSPQVFIDAQLNRPQDILFLEDQGVALVSNLGGQRITRHNATTGEYIDDFASIPGQPTRIKIGPDGLLYVLQWQGQLPVLRYQLDGTLVDEFTSVGVSQSIGMDWDSAGNLYVASFDGPNVRRFDNQGNDMGLFATERLQGPTNIWFDDNGNLVVVDWTGRAIRRYDAEGNFVATFVSGLNEPEGIEFLDNGNFLIGNGGTSSVREYQPDGTFVGDFVTPGLGGLEKPNALRFRTLEDPFGINFGLTGGWFNAETGGQGIMIEIISGSSQLFLTWFTYEAAAGKIGSPDHRWLSGLGTYDGNRVEIDLQVTSGGLFDDPIDVERTAPGTIGSVVLEFQSCTQGTMTYDIADAAAVGLTKVSNSFSIQRLAGAPQACIDAAR